MGSSSGGAIGRVENFGAGKRMVWEWRLGCKVGSGTRGSFPVSGRVVGMFFGEVGVLVLGLRECGLSEDWAESDKSCRRKSGLLLRCSVRFRGDLSL